MLTISVYNVYKLNGTNTLNCEWATIAAAIQHKHLRLAWLSNKAQSIISVELST